MDLASFSESLKSPLVNHSIDLKELPYKKHKTKLIADSDRLNTSASGRDYYFKHIHARNRALIGPFKDPGKLQDGFIFFDDVQQPTFNSRV